MNKFEYIAACSSILGALLGIPSFVFSLMAFREAALAKRAAQKTEERVSEVRGAFQNLSVAEELHYLSSRASELLLFIDSDQYDKGRYVARELWFELNRALKHWDFLDPNTKLHLKDTSNRLKTITEFLRDSSVADRAPKKAALLAQCDEVANSLRSETGKIQALLERR